MNESQRVELPGDRDLLPCTVQESEMTDEMNWRSWKAGHTTRCGECPRGTKIQNLVVFGEQKLNVWPRDEQGNLIGD